METKIKAIFEIQIKTLPKQSQKLYKILIHKIDFDENQNVIRLFNLLNIHHTFFIDRDYGSEDRSFVRSYIGTSNHRSINNSNVEYNLLSKTSVNNAKAKYKLVDFLLKELQKYSDKRLLKLYMSPATKDYDNIRCATDTQAFLQYINNTDNSYDLLYDDRVGNHRFSFYPLGAPEPGWGISTYKIAKITSYKSLNWFSVRSIYKDGKQNRFPLFTLLFSIPIEELPELLIEYISLKEIDIRLFQKYRNKYKFKMQLQYPNNTDYLH